MLQIERTVTVGSRLSRIEDALPKGFHELDSAELANVEGGESISNTVTTVLNTVRTVVEPGLRLAIGPLTPGERAKFHSVRRRHRRDLCPGPCPPFPSMRWSFPPSPGGAHRRYRRGVATGSQ